MLTTLLITSDFLPMTSGISCQLYYTWRLLPKDKVIILAPKLKGAGLIDKQMPVKIIRRIFPVSNVSLLARLVKMSLLPFYVALLIKKFNITKLHCSAPMSTGFCGLILKKIMKMPYVVYVYGGEITKYTKFKPSLFFMKSILFNAERIIANSNYSAGEFIDYFHIPKERFIVVNPGVDTNKFVPGQRLKILEDKYNLRDKKVILTVARLAERKGYDMVLKALPEVIKEIPDLVYLIVGSGSDEKKLKKLTQDLKLTDKVIFTGFIRDDEIVSYYQACDLFVMPNRETKGVLEAIEGFGISFIEANACGKAVIGGKSGGVTDSIEDGKTGMLVDPLSQKDIASAIIKLLKDEQLSKKMGEYARMRAEKYFKWDNLSKKLEDLLD
jgi:phosphatidylinositol alpha-1,6-mannosyltransferase